MSYFSQDFIAFFKELAKNNHKDWFHANKKRYEGSVKKPFYNFLDDLILEMAKYEEDFNIEAKDCVLRINRDVRFAKDKTPYNIHYTAFVSKGGRKDKSQPGIFIRFSPKMLGIMGGCLGPDRDQLAKIRRGIAKDNKTFRKVISDKSFIEKYGEIRGDVHKRVDAKTQEAAKEEPLIMNKQFYFIAELSPKLITSKKLLTEVMDHYHAAKPVNDYLKKCIS